MSTPSPAVAWIAGATGYTGREVVRHASLSGQAVYAHIRPDSPSAQGQWARSFQVH